MRELKLFDKPKNVTRLSGHILSFTRWPCWSSDFFIHKHGEFPWEGYPEFFAVYGFVSCVALIFIAKVLRLFIKRDENYYD